MKNSGIKRGLAVVAISALAITAVPGIASAQSIDDAVGNNDIEFYTGTNQSNAFDGLNNTVHLISGAGANVVQVRYERVQGATVTEIATVPRTNGVFSTEWTPPALGGNNLTVRVVGLDADGAEIGSATTTEKGINVETTPPSLDIGNPEGDDLGVFRQPYAGDPGGRNDVLGQITGTTSLATSTPGNVLVQNWDARFTANFPDNGTYGTGQGAVIMGAPDGDGIRTFTGAANFESYNVLETGPDAVNEALISANVPRIAAPLDFEVVNLVDQVITELNAEPEDTMVEPDETVDGVLTVLDQFGDPVIGAQIVRDANDNGIQDAGDTVSYTNPLGQVTYPGLADTDDTEAGTTYAFYVNTDNGNNFDPTVDFRETITVTEIVPFVAEPTTLTATSADGPAFDVDENADGDLQVLVEDQLGDPIEGQDIDYELSVDPFDAEGDAPDPATGTVTSDADGLADIPFTELADGEYTLSTFIEVDGNAGQGPTDLPADELVFKAGDSTLAFADSPGGAESPVGTTDTYDASLTLGDDTPLAGRDVDFDFSQADGGNAVVADDADQPAGTTRDGDAAASGTTGDDGTVSVALTDPASPVQEELGGTLDAATADTEGIGNADETATTLDVDFVFDGVPDGTVVTVDVPDAGTPGVLAEGTVTTDADPDAAGNQAVPGAEVTLTIEEGFFSSGDFDPAPVEGADFGEFDSLGQEITVTTEADGTATFDIGIERNEGFDDDGMVDDSVTSTLGDSTDSDTITWDSSDPINGGELRLEISPEGVQDNPTDPALVDDEIAVDVFTTDQFGNLVGGEDVAITTDGDDATVDPATAVSDFEDDGDFTVSSAVEDAFTVTGTWNAPFTEFGPGPGFDELTGSRDLTDTLEVDFVEPPFDLDAATVTFTGSPEEEALVGGEVTETLTVLDEDGEPVAGLPVEFTQTGPGANSGTAEAVTDDAGVATYVFTGTVAGTATIAAEISNPDDAEQTRTVTDTVDFVEPPFDLDAATVTFTGSPEVEAPVGGEVTETLTVLDEDGEPVAGLPIEFTQTGPGANSGTAEAVTDDAGVATYVFTGTVAGTATIAAEISNPDDAEQTRTVTDTVVFVAPDPDPDPDPEPGFDLDAAAVTFTGDPEDEALIGAEVTETVTVLDEDGDPVAGLPVVFTQTGPGDDSGTGEAVTDADGMATYVFTGTEAGTATISAEISTADGEQMRTVTDTVSFAAAEPEPDFDLDAAQVTIVGNPEVSAPVNTAVTEMVTVLDEDGDPVAGLPVVFTQTGPGANSGTAQAVTNANGVATYVFVGTESGAATISAVISTVDGEQTRTVTDTVAFSIVIVDPPRTVAKLKGQNNGAKRNDKLKVVANRFVSGADARLIVVRKGKRNIVVQEKTLNRRGNANFKVRDRNRRGITKYRVIVQAQPGINTRARSNAKRIR